MFTDERTEQKGVAMIEVLNGVPNPRVEEAVLFAFDDVRHPVHGRLAAASDREQAGAVATPWSCRPAHRG